MSVLEINGIKLYAYHGYFEEEQKIGQYYITDIYLEADMEQGIINDDLLQTIDYTAIYRIVKSEMVVPSSLIEHVAYRIREAIKTDFKRVTKVKVSIYKPLPPVNGEIESVKITV